jgi:OOP family OmpA-OmpF porin
MKRKGFYFLVALALGGVGAVHAQDNSMAADSTSMTTPSYDGRWYIAPTVGGYYNDSDRNTNSRQFYYGLGVGRFISPNISIEAFIDRTKRDRDSAVGGGSWANNNLGVTGRYYVATWDTWRPYLLGGIMGSQHHNDVDNGWSPAAELGAGISKSVSKSSDIRMEGGYRYDWDDKTQPSKNGYGDWFLGFSVVSRFGEPAAAPAPAPVAPPPAAPDCSTLDSDKDGVNDCDDKCPATPAGTIVGPDGCPQKVVIDLRGVNFKFDRPRKNETDISKALAEPSADSIAILDQAVDTLQRYPQVHVTVAGYTDSVGTDAYNQSLSERRAKIVYDYLTAHGIDASRLEGPIGHGENDPIDSNDTDAGRARNRRTELQVQQ